MIEIGTVFDKGTVPTSPDSMQLYKTNGLKVDPAGLLAWLARSKGDFLKEVPPTRALTLDEAVSIQTRAALGNGLNSISGQGHVD